MAAQLVCKGFSWRVMWQSMLVATRKEAKAGQPRLAASCWSTNPHAPAPHL
jgi:hypothetical protein